METELQRLTREISERMTRVSEIIFAERPSDTSSTLISCQSHNEDAPTFGVAYFGGHDPITRKPSIHYTSFQASSFSVAAVKALEKGNQV